MSPNLVSDQEFSGGAIYIGDNCTLYLTNVLIHNNKLTQKFMTSRDKDKGIFAGGIGLCPNSIARFFITNGGAIYNNNGADILFVPNSTNIGLNKNASLYVSNNALGNGEYNWTNLDGKNVNGGFQSIQNDNILSFKSHLSSQGIANAQNQGLVEISDNSTESVYGGGAIMCNGTLQIGTSGDISVSKSVSGNAADTNKEFHFTVTLSDNTINGQYGDMYFENGISHFTLKHGQTITATNLPSGITYTVIEDEANKDGYTTQETNSTGQITGSNIAYVTFNNHKDTQLTVSKTVTGEGDKEKEYHFTVTLSDNTINGQYGDMYFENGVSHFTLKHGQTKTAVGLPVGISYEVTEDEANKNGYTTKITGGKGIISTDKPSEAIFINDKINKKIITAKNPNTNDNINSWLSLFGLSVLSIVISAIFRKKLFKS